MVLTHFSIFFLEGAKKSAPSMGGVGLPPNRWCTAGATHVAKRFCVFGTNRLAIQRSRSPGDFLLEPANCVISRVAALPCAFIFLISHPRKLLFDRFGEQEANEPCGEMFFSRQTFSWEECHKRAGGAISSERKRCQVVYQIYSQQNKSQSQE